MSDNESTPVATPAVAQSETPDLSTDNSIDGLLGEFGDLFGGAETAAVAAPTEAAPAPVAPVTPAAEATPEATEATPEQLSPFLAAASKRERETRAELEQATSGTEAAVAEARKELLAELVGNPQAFIAKHGIENAGDLALGFYVAELGEDAPPELRAQVGMSDLEQFKRATAKQFEEMRISSERQVIEARNKAVITQYEGFISDIPTSLPYLASEASEDATEVLSTMAQVADHIYQSKGQYPSATEVASLEVASLIERTLEATAARYQAVNRPQPTLPAAVPAALKTVPVKEKPITTLSTEHSGASASAATCGEDECFDDALDYLSTMFP